MLTNFLLLADKITTMKTSFFLFVALTITGYASAQPTITQADFATVGDTITRAVDTLGTGLTIGNSGPNQTWDFSGAATHVVENTAMITAAQSPWSQFGTVSNLCMTSDPDAYLYFNSNPNNLRINGFGQVSTGWISGYDDDIVLYQFPTNYQDDFYDFYQFDINVDGAPFGVDEVRLKRVVDTWDTIDAYGTVITSLYTYDCLRKKRVEFVIDSVWTKLFPFLPFSFGGRALDTVVSYTWMANNSKLAVIEASLDSVGNVTRLVHTLVPGIVASSCAAPTGVETINIQPTSARFSWVPEASADHYQIRGRLAGGAFWVYLNVPNPVSSFFNASGLINNTTYQWQIRTFCDVAETDSSDWSALLTFTTGCMEPDSTWTTAIGLNTATLNWTKRPGAEGYEIRGRRIGASGWVSLLVGGVNTTSKTVFGLNPGLSYEWTVRAICSNAANIKSPYPATITFTTATTNRLANSPTQSMASFETQTLKVVPNPFSKQAIIEVPIGFSGLMRLIDLNGQKVWSGFIERGIRQIHLLNSESGLPILASGIYLLTVEDQSVLPIKVLVQNQ